MIVSSDDDRDGFVTVTVTNATGRIRYRVPVEPLRLPDTSAPSVSVASAS